MTKASKKYRLNYKDLLKGALVSISSSVVASIQTMISSNAIDWKIIGSVAFASLVAYLLKNFFTDDETVKDK